MAEKKLVPVEKFREVALNNGYEVFNETQVADYAKDAMVKSQAGALSKEDKDEFAVEMAGLMKAICANEDGSQCTLYYRKPLVDWKVDGSGVVMKGIAGTYTDTPENRKLNRVGQAYVPSSDVIKSIYGAVDNDMEGGKVDAGMAEQASSIRKSCAVVAADAERRFALGEIDEEICKSVKTEVGMYLTSWGDTLDECCDVVKSEDLADVREDLADAKAAFADIVKAAHGRYADTAKNRRLHRVGQEYGKAAQEKDKGEKKQSAADGGSGEKSSRNGDSVKRDLSILEENRDRIVEKYGQEAYDRKVEALKKEGDDYEQKETVKQLKDRADKQDAEEEERKKAEKRAKRQEKRRARHAAKREAAKKAKEEAEAKAKAESEKQSEIEEKVKQFPKGWERKANGDDSEVWAMVLEDKMSPEEFDALYDESKSKKKWREDWTNAIKKYLSVDEVKDLMDPKKRDARAKRLVEDWQSKISEAKTLDEALNLALEAGKAFRKDPMVTLAFAQKDAFKNPNFEKIGGTLGVEKYVESIINEGASPKEAKSYVKELVTELKDLKIPDRLKNSETPEWIFRRAEYPDRLSDVIDAKLAEAERMDEINRKAIEANKKNDIESKGKFVSGGGAQPKEEKKESPEKNANDIELTSKGIKDYVDKNSTTPDARMQAMAAAYKALKDGGKGKKVDTFVKEVSTGSPRVDMTTRKYVEATMAGATHEEAKVFAEKEFDILERGIQMAQTAAEDELPQGMVQHLLKTAYAVFDKAKFTKK